MPLPSRQERACSPIATLELLWPLLLMLTALALGSYRLTDKSLWVDEAASAGFALGGPSAWVVDHNMALYYMLLGAWVRVFGSGELALRAPSVLCFVATVPLMYCVARAAFGVSAARVASALQVANAFMLQFAQEARGYMLVVLLVLSAQLALVCLLDRPRLRFGLIYGLCLGLASYAHLFAFWTLLAHICVLAPRWLRPAPERRAGLFAFGLAALISTPLLVQAATATTAQVSWIRPLSARALLALPVIWTGGGTLLACLLCALFAVFARGVYAPEPRLRLHTQLCLAWLLVPLAAAVLLSVCVAPMLIPKYLIGAVPALQLGAAVTLTRLPRRLALTAGALLLALCALRFQDWYSVQQKERWRESVQLLAARMQPTAPLVLDLPSPEVFDYYVKQLQLDKRWAAPRWPVRGWAFPTPNEKPVTRAQALAQLNDESPARIWLIGNRGAGARELGPLAERYQVESEEQLRARGDTADELFGAHDALVITVRLLVRR